MKPKKLVSPGFEFILAKAYKTASRYSASGEDEPEQALPNKPLVKVTKNQFLFPCTSFLFLM